MPSTSQVITNSHEPVFKPSCYGRNTPQTFAPEAIRNQVQKILLHSEFAYADRLKKFLHFVVEETIAGRSDQLKEFTIGSEVFGKGGSFDPQTDTIVRVSAGNLRRRLNQYYLTDGQGDRIHLELPKGSYVPLMHLNGNGNGKKEEKEKRGTERTMYTLPPQRSIAVLPITNMDGDASHDVLCDGMTEDITTRLARIPDLLVIARSSTLQYKGQTVNIKQLGQELGVRYILTGSVRMVERTLRMTAQLIDAITGSHIWAEMYDRAIKRGNILKIQDEILDKVTETIVEIMLTGVSPKSKPQRKTESDKM